MTETIFRIHPFLNIARVGNSSEFYIAPETAAGHVVDPETGVYGGLPIKKGTESTFIEEADLRDDQGNMVRQAARFRLYAFSEGYDSYPNTNEGKEIKVGDTLDVGGGSKTVKDILWTVHLANKKGNNFTIRDSTNTLPNWPEDQEKVTELGIISYENGKLPPIRNLDFGSDLNDVQRRKELVIDAGPRAISAANCGTSSVAFDVNTTPCYADGTTIINLDDYPVSFPFQHFSSLFQPHGRIDTLGEMMIEKDTGRLIVAGGYGRAERIPGGDPATEPPRGKLDAVDNDRWFDDTSDGPVTATILFDDGTSVEAVHSWFVCTDPAFAPQVRNIVSAWDDMFTTWVEKMDLMPSLFSSGEYNQDYTPSFMDELQPIFHGAFLQQWNTALPDVALGGHGRMSSVTAATDPTRAINNLDSIIRNPADLDNDGLIPMDSSGTKSPTVETKLMPMALGDAMKSFLTLTPTQYFFVKQWHTGKAVESFDTPTGTDALDRAVLENCLGGRYSPGIDVTFIVRDTNLYDQNWKGRSGPFRFNMASLNYKAAETSTPFLGVGYIPLRSTAVEPGDICKFMSLPWHTDYNSCSIHLPDPNVQSGQAGGSDRGPTVMGNTLYWSWPSQRPVQIYPKEYCTFSSTKNAWVTGGQLFSVRGQGTLTDNPASAGAFQNYYDFIEQWDGVGFVIQGTQVPTDENGPHYGADLFIEVSSKFDNESDLVQPWPSGFVPLAS